MYSFWKGPREEPAKAKPAPKARKRTRAPAEGTKESKPQKKKKSRAKADKDKPTKLGDGIVAFPPAWKPPTALRNTGPTYFCADEAGRGALAGYMALGVVALPPESDPKVWACVKDSKAYKDTKRSLARDKRMVARAVIEEHAAAYVVVAASVEAIDRLNVTQAGYRGIHFGCEWMLCHGDTSIVEKMAAEGFWVVAGRPFPVESNARIEGILMDGKGFKPLIRPNGDLIPYATYTKGDARVLGIAAASVLAKSYRDYDMCALTAEFPELHAYEIGINKGYAAYGADKHGQVDHRKAIAEHGFTLSHRLTFDPVKTLYAGGQAARPVGRRGLPPSSSSGGGGAV